MLLVEVLIEGNLEVKRPTKWRKAERSRVRRKKIQVRESQKKADTVARKVRKVARLCFSNDSWVGRVEK